MKKILLLATGGTIASVPSEEGLTPKLTAKELTSYITIENQPYRLHSQILMNIDSTNMQPEHWRDIAEAIYTHYDQYDGFVVTHGTDTMARQSNAPRKMPGKHRKVFRRTHRLNAVIRIVRNFFFAKQISFDSYCFCLHHLRIPTFFLFWRNVIGDWRFHDLFHFKYIRRFS